MTVEGALQGAAEVRSIVAQLARRVDVRVRALVRQMVDRRRIVCQQMSAGLVDLRPPDRADGDPAHRGVPERCRRAAPALQWRAHGPGAEAYRDLAAELCEPAPSPQYEPVWPPETHGDRRPALRAAATGAVTADEAEGDGGPLCRAVGRAVGRASARGVRAADAQAADRLGAACSPRRCHDRKRPPSARRTAREAHGPMLIASEAGRPVLPRS